MYEVFQKLKAKAFWLYTPVSFMLKECELNIQITSPSPNNRIR